jgi:16S rRNA (adenine1518-N6/adenine1519-N6)-dimethyltransferase
MTSAKKSFGQHFLHDQSHIARIIEAAAIRPTDMIVEVGPGRGALTQHLVAQGDRLHLIELDRDLAPALQEQYPQARLHLEDAAHTNYATLVQEPWVFVSNLPYNAGNAILMNVLETVPAARRVVIMVQKEVGERMRLVEEKERGVLGVAVQSYAHVENMWIVPPGAFSPPPKVDSAVLVLTPRQLNAVERAQVEKVIRLAKAGFAHRRQQLQKTLAGAGYGESGVIMKALEALGHTKSARPQELTLQDWQQLSTNL